MRQGIIVSLIIGIPVTLIFFFIPEIPLNLIYNTNEGITYIKILSIFFILQYINAPLASTLQAIGKATVGMYGTLIGIFIKLTTLSSCLYLFGIFGLIISLIVGIIFSFIYNYYQIRLEV